MSLELPGGTVIDELPLFPLQSVLLPGGLLSLKVFEARYLDLIGTCMRQTAPFGVVCLTRGHEVRCEGEDVQFEPVGVLAHLAEVDSDAPGILRVRCVGGQRFTLGRTERRDDGLWIGREVALLAPDEAMDPGPEFASTAQALGAAIAALAEQDTVPFATPHRLDDAGWVANRWCELLPIPLAARQMLMALQDPLLRLKLVDEYLREQGVVS